MFDSNKMQINAHENKETTQNTNIAINCIAANPPPKRILHFSDGTLEVDDDDVNHVDEHQVDGNQNHNQVNNYL